MLALDLLHRQLSYSVLRGREMPPIDTGRVPLITGEAKRTQSGLELEAHAMLPGPDDIREPSTCVMIKCMPEPSLSRFGHDETAHFIEIGCASWLVAPAAVARMRRWC